MRCLCILPVASAPFAAPFAATFAASRRCFSCRMRDRIAALVAARSRFGDCASPSSEELASSAPALALPRRFRIGRLTPVTPLPLPLPPRPSLLLNRSSLLLDSSLSSRRSVAATISSGVPGRTTELFVKAVPEASASACACACAAASALRFCRSLSKKERQAITFWRFASRARSPEAPICGFAPPPAAAAAAALTSPASESDERLLRKDGCCLATSALTPAAVPG